MGLDHHGGRLRPLWVPIIRSWALTRGFALHPGTRNRYEIRYTRTQHRPPSRQVNDHDGVSGTHTPQAHDYDISGRSPLQWAIDSLRRKTDKYSGIVDDPNGWHEWADEPFNLIRHLRRLVRLSVETARIVASLPPSLTPDDATS